MAGALLLLLLPPLLWLSALTLLVLVMVVLMVVVLLVLLLALRLQLLLGVALRSGYRLEVEEDVVLEVRGDRLRAAGVRGLLLGCRDRAHGVRWVAGRLLCICGFGFRFGRGLVDEGGGEGRGG